MRNKLFIAVLMVAAVLWLGCPEDDNDTPEPAQTEDNASGTVTTTTSGTIETELGARIVVPIGAVPPLENGNPGAMVFSIEKNNSINVTPPSGENVVSDIYQFGPEGFTFARPVEVAVPVPGDGDPGELSLWRRNPTTGIPEYFSSEYDPATRTVKAQTYTLSPWFISSRQIEDDASGCVHVTNTGSSWLYICVETYQLEYPPQTEWIPEAGQGVLYAPFGTIGWTHSGNWYLPQGTYTFCLQRESSINPGEYSHRITEPITISNAWHYSSPDCAELSSGDFVTADPGRCGCIPEPTSSVGTGDIQVTLTWYNENSLDLDLWVQDPNEEWCYYGNGQAPNVTSSGGQLDRDNLCGNYENGRPENIYWTTTPPAGQYIVAVDWFSDCGNDLGSQSINVRTVVRGVTRTFNTSIAPDEQMKEITRFSISGTTVNFLPPQTDYRHEVVRAAKN